MNEKIFVAIAPAASNSVVLQAKAVQDATKDTGRVHLGGGMMNFDGIKDSGRVHMGGGMMRF